MQKRFQKVIAVLLSVVLLCAAVPMCASALETGQVYLGDVDGNNKVNAIDARYVLQKASGARELSDLGLNTGDVNRDGKVNAVDARWILQFASGARLPKVLDTQTNTVSLEATLNKDSTSEEIVEYFNLVLNRVKPFAARITMTRAATSLAGEIEGTMPDGLRNILLQLLAEDLGEQDVSGIAPATTVAEKNELFPVSGEAWSSKLTAQDVETLNVQETADTYCISITVLADPLSADTQPYGGHFGKVYTVMTPADAGVGADMAKDIQTGNRGITVTLTVEKSTGNVLHAVYVGVYLMHMQPLGRYDVTLPTGFEEEYDIAW